MSSPLATTHNEDGFELRFASLFHEGRALSFPCDAQGHVDIDALSERARNNYLLARAAVGRDYAKPVVQPVAGCTAHSRAAWVAQALLGTGLRAMA